MRYAGILRTMMAYLNRLALSNRYHQASEGCTDCITHKSRSSCYHTLFDEGGMML